jgi:hypothetical protein
MPFFRIHRGGGNTLSPHPPKLMYDLSYGQNGIKVKNEVGYHPLTSAPLSPCLVKGILKNRCSLAGVTSRLSTPPPPISACLEASTKIDC